MDVWEQSGLMIALGAAATGCGSHGQAATANHSTPLIVVAADFDDFCSWSSAAATANTDASDGVHGLGALTVYWNHSPPSGSSAFPVGTIIVKESNEADVTQRTVFAMAKVGGDYNATGAVGWEWFSLVHNPDCTVTILWQGPAPVIGESYAGTPAGDCNGCHALADNDFVWDTALQLSNF